MPQGSFEIIASDKDTVQVKVCRQCGAEKTLDGFRREKNGVLGRKATCKECSKPIIADYNRKYRNRETPDEMIQRALDKAAYRILKERLD